MAVQDRIDELRHEAEEAIGAAGDTAALEDLRVRYLGRKAELPNLLRGVAGLPPEQRGAVGKAANQARQALERLIGERQASLAAVELDARLAADRVDVTLPGAPVRPVGRCTSSPPPGGRSRTSSAAWASPSPRARRSSSSTTTSTRSTTTPAHPARGCRTPSTSRRTPSCAPTRRPCRCGRWSSGRRPSRSSSPGAVYRRDSDATHTPQFHQVEGLWVDEDITLADLKGTLLAFAARSSAPSARCACARTSSPSPSRRSRWTSRASSAAARAPARRRALQPVQGDGLDRDPRLGDGRPNVFGYVREHGYDPERVQGFAFGMGIERIAQLKHGLPDMRQLYDNDLRLLEQFG
jgi:phenylalanyl-tRNA synthetase alpha chain